MTTCCSHNWIGNRGSNDKPCMYCFKYPVLYLRYQCDKCHKEACTFCLKDLNIPVPSIQKQPNLTSKHETFEIRILHLEILLHELHEKLEILELRLKRNG